MSPPAKSTAGNLASAAQASADEDDDYMTMTFEEPQSFASSKPETTLQRRQRLRREAEARARPKSKAELAEEADAARERALATSLLDDPRVAAKSKGFAMMARMGFAAGDKLGAAENAANARAEPIRVSARDKEDRGGIGLDNEKRRRVREAAEEAGASAKRAKVEEGDFRLRVAREREVARLERQVHAAQKVAQGMEEDHRGGNSLAGGGEQAEEKSEEDEAEDEGNQDDDAEDESAEKTKTKKRKRTGISSRPLKSINVLWRGLVKAREVAERDRRMRYDLHQSLSRLPTYEDDQEDEDDRKALGKNKVVYATADDLDEEDAELDEFEELDPADKLEKLVLHLREQYHYCFWCKTTYPDEKMEGCPGITEEDHD